MRAVREELDREYEAPNGLGEKTSAPARQTKLFQHFSDLTGKSGTAQVEVSYCRMRVRSSIGKQKRYPTLVLTLLHAREPQEPAGRPRIDWKQITDLSVDSHDDAVEKLQWYAMRWKIEVFHKILKSGCPAEQARLRTAERLVRLIALFCILSWRVFWLTMLNRVEPNLELARVLSELETSILDRLIPDPAHDPPAARTLSSHSISPRSPGLAVISPAPKTRRRETSSCGAASPV